MNKKLIIIFILLNLIVIVLDFKLLNFFSDIRDGRNTEFYLNMEDRLNLINFDNRPRSIPINKIKQLTFQKDRKIKYPYYQAYEYELNCEESKSNQKFCINYSIESIECVHNGDNNWSCHEINLPIFITFSKQEVKCYLINPFPKTGPIYFIDGSCFLIYSLKFNWPIIIGLIVLIVILIGSILILKYNRNKKL